MGPGAFNGGYGDVDTLTDIVTMAALLRKNKDLTAEVAGLDSALAKMAGEKTKAVTTMVNKHESMEQYDRTFSAAANLISTLLKVAGENELARRVRPSTRKPGQTVEVAKDELAPGDEPAAEVSPS